MNENDLIKEIKSHKNSNENLLNHELEEIDKIISHTELENLINKTKHNVSNQIRNDSKEK